MKRSSLVQKNVRQQAQKVKGAGAAAAAKAAAAATAASAGGGANAGEGTNEDAFIDVSVPGGAAAPAAGGTKGGGSGGVVALHDFTSCTTKFAGLLSGGGGLEFSVTSAAPTLSISGGGGGVLSGGVDEFVATRLFLVPKLHASNRLPQVSASDLEVVIEHGRSAAAGGGGGGGGKPRRYFLCAVVSGDAQIPDADEATATKDGGGGKLIGADAAMQAFLRNIDISGGPADRAALRDRNAKLLPLDTALTFPGVGECMSYTDAAGDVVLLAAAPLLVAPALVARLFAIVSAGGAPVFTNFDLAPAPGGAVSVVAFRANRSSAADATLLSGGAVAAAAALAAAADAGGGVDDADDEGEGEAADGEGFQEGMKKKKKKKGGDGGGGSLTAAQVLGMVVLLVVAAVLVLPAWLYGPRVYASAVVAMSDMPDRHTLDGAPASVSAGIKRARLVMMLVGMLAAALVGVGAALGDAGYGSLLAGLLLALALGTLNAAVYFDLGVRGTSVVRALPNISQSKIDHVLWRDSYDIGGGGSK